MKNAACCDNWCELQDTLNTELSNAHGGLLSSRTGGLAFLRVLSYLCLIFGSIGQVGCLPVGSSVKGILPSRLTRLVWLVSGGAFPMKGHSRVRPTAPLRRH
ncbi:hypothetical protein NPIL_589441 [Nephila pilipes]|uniref:Uncharacterized protein n=1 Tax=Nephila pilipes TaxID=299642 RepID=A0A8X6PBM9_NEPPI|nr:hypothetical protein NPIL_589441 [Nephila pilipes]